MSDANADERDAPEETRTARLRGLLRPKRPSWLFLSLPAAVVAAIVAFALSVLSSQTRVVERLEHWLGDWRFAIAGARLPAAHPDITLLLIRDESLLEIGVYSPIDRALLADLIRTVDEFGPRAVGVDIIFDIETPKDAALLAALRAAQAPVVLGALEDRGSSGASAMTPGQSVTQDAFLAAAALPYGFVNIAIDFDRRVRRRAEPDPEGAPVSFADRVAEAAGVTLPETLGSDRIDWLVPPANGGDTFTRIYADQLPALSAAPALLERVFKDRVVIIAAGLRGMADYHLTPLDQSDGSRTIGAEIVAQMVAERMDGRAALEMTGDARLFLTALAAFLTALLILRHGRVAFDAPIALIVLFAVDLAVFASTHIVAPLGVMTAGVAVASLAAGALRNALFPEQT